MGTYCYLPEFGCDIHIKQHWNELADLIGKNGGYKCTGSTSMFRKGICILKLLGLGLLNQSCMRVQTGHGPVGGHRYSSKVQTAVCNC